MHTTRTTANGKVRWVADLGNVNGQRVRRYFRTRREADAEVATARLQRQQAGDVWLSLTAAERLDAARVIMEARARGMTIGQLLHAHDNHAPRLPRVSLRDAVNVTVATKRAGGRRERYLAGLEAYLTAFAKGREEMPIAAIHAQDVEAWFASRNESPSTRASNVGRLSAMFALALRRGWVKENPARMVEPVRLEQRPPVILTPRQAARALSWARRHRPRWLAHVALGLLAGIRPEELLCIRWSSVNFADGVVVIDAEASKVRRRRIVHLEPAASEWLTVAKASGATLPLGAQTARRCRRMLRRVLRMETWPQDVLRHTAASYMLALRQDAGAVALELGNSPGVLLRVYRELVTRRDAARFWGMRPRRWLHGI